MLLKRYNREDVPFASGFRALLNQLTELDAESWMVLVFARNFFNRFGMEWGGIDVVIDRKCDPCTETLFMLETTIGWKQSAYADCVFL